MPTHVSVRLFWHDSGWNGAICRDPAANVWCEAHDHVRDHKPAEEADDDSRGRRPREAGVYPGCESSVQAFSSKPNEIRVWPPDWMAADGVQPVEFDMEQASTGMWPYEEMWTEDGGFKSNDERRAIAERFFNEVEQGKSLAFFYVDERNPLFVEDGERSPHRVLVGISRIKSLANEIREWNEATWNGEINMVWSVPFKHAYPDDGIRLPVQAIQAAVTDPEERARFLVALDRGIRTDFRYGSSRVSLDRAVAVVERAIAALDRLQSEGVIETSVERELDWLNGILLELWEDRGPYPGVAPLLSFLGCSRAAEISSKALAEVAAKGRDAAAVLFNALDGELDPSLGAFEDEIADATDEWGFWQAAERELAKLLVRMELQRDQMESVLGSPERRQDHGLPADAAEIVNNPYLLCERFVPLRDHEPVSFLTVDHGLLPHESMAPLKEHRIQRRDARRLRALLCEELRAKAEDGHTFLHARDVLAAAVARSPEDRPCDVPLDRLAHEKVAPVLDEVLEQFEIDDEPYLAIRAIREDELQIQSAFGELVSRPPNDAGSIEWQEISDQLAEERGEDRVDLSPQQREALERTFRSPLSVLTGAAGTGKSTLLAPLIEAIRRAEGAGPVRALTPTGKAADRLIAIGVEAMTIHRALALTGWFDWKLGIWVDGEEPVAAETLIIDECSMVDVELLAMLFRAVDWQGVRRLVLVGDHHQLPPIGPGRPFFDLIAVMQSADDSASHAHERYAGRLSELTHNYRVDEGSSAIAFANSFARQAEPDEALVWEAVAKGRDVNDLRVRFWDEPEELHEKLLAEIESLVERECEEEGLDLKGGRAFNATIGHGTETPFRPTHWQILTPMKGSAHGSRKVNALIQDRYHRWAKEAKRWNGAYSRWPVKFGNEQITAFDKVMQISNQRLPYWRSGMSEEEKNERTAVFNGQIGTVKGEWPRAHQKYRQGPKEKGPVKSISVEFEGAPGIRFGYWKTGWRAVDRHLELAYAITVHKGQGSQFSHVFFVIPQEAAQYFGRELTYTGLTRAQSTLTLFIERDMGTLLALRKLASAQTPQRNSRLFSPEIGTMAYRAGRLVYGTDRGERVASKSELIIHNLLYEYERRGDLSFTYEEELFGPSGDRWDFRLPDFTVRVAGKIYYWEHCGMMDDEAYRQKWERVRRPWYKKNGLDDRLIVTEDGPSAPIDSGRIRREVIEGQLLAG